MRRLILVLLAGLVSRELAPARSEAAPPLDAASDQVIARVVVPSTEQTVGEVRLVKRGDADVVQTLLYVKVLSRVVAEIRKKEIANWPPGSDGHNDMERYLEALDQVRKRLWAEQPKNERRDDRRQRMLIEFVLDRSEAQVVVGTFDMDESNAIPRLTARRPDVVLRPSRTYVARNMHLIAADSFRVQGPELEALLDPLPHVKAATGAPERVQEQ